MFDELVELLKLHYPKVDVYRNEVGENCVYVTKNGITLAIIVYRFHEPKLYQGSP